METFKSEETLNQDPDYFTPFNSNASRQNVFETNARENTVKKITAIIEAEFLNEINNKKAEVLEIFKTLHKACKMLHYLRFAIVTDFYNQENTRIVDLQGLKQTRPHPTLNRPINKVPFTDTCCVNNCSHELDEDNKRKRKISHEPIKSKKSCTQDLAKNNTVTSSSLVANNKTRKRVIVGNISKWISPDFRENNASHKWTMYVRDIQKGDIGRYVSKVRFFLHPSYKPNDVVELTSPPFHLCRFGWGEFPVRVQLHFTNNFNKPVDIIHHLKLDRTFTGLQTFGMETVVDIWISIKDVSAVQNLEESDSQNINSIDDKHKNSNFAVNYHFLNDHDYTGTNTKFDGKTFCHSEGPHTLEDDTLSTSQSNINKTDVNSSRSLIKNYTKMLPKKNFESVLLSKQLNISIPHEVSNNMQHSVFRHYSKNIEHRLEYFNDAHVSSSNADINNKKIFYKHNISVSNEENSKALIKLIEEAKPRNLFSLLKFTTSRMPLITEKSTDLRYKMLHPYASESYEVFKNYSKGKQQSLERYRALSALNIMKHTKFYDDSCNIKEFMIWAKRYCYTPVLNLKNTLKICTSREMISIEDYKNYQYSSTISNQLSKWLLQSQKIKPIIYVCRENEEEIDVLNISTNITNSLSMYNNSNLKNSPIILLEYPQTQNSLNELVCKTTQKIGIKLTSEEIIPGVSHNTANVLITKAVECLVDELVRLAFSCALDKCKTQESAVSVTVDDVRMALLKKYEFEIFTNAGLGSEG